MGTGMGAGIGAGMGAGMGTGISGRGPAGRAGYSSPLLPWPGTFPYHAHSSHLHPRAKFDFINPDCSLLGKKCRKRKKWIKMIEKK